MIDRSQKIIFPETPIEEYDLRNALEKGTYQINLDRVKETIINLDAAIVRFMAEVTVNIPVQNNSDRKIQLLQQGISPAVEYQNFLYQLRQLQYPEIEMDGTQQIVAYLRLAGNDQEQVERLFLKQFHSEKMVQFLEVLSHCIDQIIPAKPDSLLGTSFSFRLADLEKAIRFLKRIYSESSAVANLSQTEIITLEERSEVQEKATNLLNRISQRLVDDFLEWWQRYRASFETYEGNIEVLQHDMGIVAEVINKTLNTQVDHKDILSEILDTLIVEQDQVVEKMIREACRSVIAESISKPKIDKFYALLQELAQKGVYIDFTLFSTLLQSRLEKVAQEVRGQNDKVAAILDISRSYLSDAATQRLEKITNPN